MAGFKSPLFILGLGAAAVTAQGGFATPIPALNIGATPAVVQAGFATPIPVLNIGATASEPPAVVPKKDAGGSSNGYKLTAAQISQIQREDEELITIINIIGEHL